MSESKRSNALEELRLMLFPHLSSEEASSRIDAAFERAGDRERLERIELLANSPDLDEELLRRVRALRDGPVL
jgi:hypothetical protein